MGRETGCVEEGVRLGIGNSGLFRSTLVPFTREQVVFVGGGLVGAVYVFASVYLVFPTPMQTTRNAPEVPGSTVDVCSARLSCSLESRGKGAV